MANKETRKDGIEIPKPSNLTNKVEKGLVPPKPSQVQNQGGKTTTNKK